MVRLEELDSAFGTITILRTRSTGSVVYEQHGHFQSECDGNGISLASYIHALFDLAVQAKARSVLLIGCAGGTLGTMLAQDGCRVTIVDINPASFPLARRYFKLPHSVECHVADGLEYLRRDARTYDAVILDAYHGDRIPVQLQSRDFFNLVRRRLSPTGAIFANVHVTDDADDCADRIAEQMSASWPKVRLLDSVGLPGRNVITMAGHVETLRRPYLRTPPEAEADVVDAELAMMEFRLPRR